MNFYFLIFELLTIALVVICLIDAYKRGWLPVFKVLAGVAFGLLLEWATIQQLQAYSYGRFNLMLAGEVPVAIGLGWGIIIYSASLFTDSLKLKPFFRPVMDALLAANIDLAMDVVAIRLGMWDWGIPLNSAYFGVKWGNFWAWFWVVFFFSAAFRIFSTRRWSLLKWLTPLLAILIGTAGVLGTNFVITALVPSSIVPFVVFGLLAGALILVILQKPKIGAEPQPLPVILVPLTFHLYFLITGLVSGALLSPPVLLFISLAMFGVSLWLHRRLFSRRQMNRKIYNIYNKRH